MNKLAIIFILILTLGYGLGGVTGYLYRDYNISNDTVGAVRSRSAGFYVISGDNIAIGTSTPTANFHVYETATTSVAIDGETMGCVVLRDKTTNNLEYYISDNQEWATTTAADCGF